MAHSTDQAITDPAEFWEARYITNRDDTGHVWSGRVNVTIEHEVANLTPGSVLDLGCGEGETRCGLPPRAGPSRRSTSQGRLWRSERRRQPKTDLPIASTECSPTSRRGIRRRSSTSAAFLHSPVELPREEILRRASSAVARGGRLLVVGHGAFPPGSRHSERDHDAPPLPTPDHVLASLELRDGWVVETNALFDRPVTWRDGTPLTLVDTVLRIRRER